MGRTAEFHLSCHGGTSRGACELGPGQAIPVSLGIALRRIVIAGGPGSGKSTLLRALAESGEICYEESSRVLIREQLAKSGQLLPWADLWAFAQECSARMQAQLQDSTKHRLSFFDR